MALVPARIPLRAAAWFVALSPLAAACGASSPAPEDARPSPGEVAPSASPADAWVVKPPPPGPPRTEPLPQLTAAPTCVITDGARRSFAVTAFGAASGRAPALVVDGSARVLLNASERLLEITSRAEDGAGYVVLAQLVEPVYLKESVGIAGGVTPTSTEALSIVKVSGASVTLASRGTARIEGPPERPKLGADLRTAAMATPTRHEVPPIVMACEGLALGPRPSALESQLALAAVRVGVSPTPADEPRFWYSPPARNDAEGGARLGVELPRPPPAPPPPRFDGPAVEVVQKQGSRAHVRFVTDGYHVDGWIEAKRVGKRTAPADEPEPPARPRALAVPPSAIPSGRQVRCQEDVAIYVSSGFGEKIRTGTIFAGTTIAILGTEASVVEGLRDIAVAGIAPSLSAGEHPRAPVAALARCGTR